MPATIAIILGRGGSKGVPGKNTRVIAGKPCVLWSIEAARAAQRVDHVLVSSDDARLLDIARGATTGGGSGVSAIARPDELASDTARVDDAARHAAEAGARALGLARPNIVILYANVPVRPAGLIDRAIALLESTGCDSVQSYAPVGKFHPWWIARVDEKSGMVRPWEGEVLNHNVFRRQDLPTAFIPDGGVIAVTWGALFHEVAGAQDGPHRFFGADRRGVINPEGGVVDIDSAEDVAVAEAALGNRARV
jgi:N-acylneuraminate cytidylyltransferase